MSYCAAGILLKRSDGAFLLQHRDENITYYPGYWGFFGGGLEEGETPEGAMIRETKEELSITVVEHRLALERDFVDAAGIQRHVWIFIAPFEVQQPLRLCEGQGMGWFFQDDISHFALAPHDQEMLLEIFERERGV